MATRTKERSDPFELSGGRAPFPLGLSITAAVIVGLAPAAAAQHVYWGVDPRADAVRYAWVYAGVALACVLTLAWPAAAFRFKTERRPWDLPAIVLGALPAMTLSAWMAVVPLMQAGKTCLMLAAVGLWMQGMISVAGRSSRVQASIAGAAAALSLGVPALAYLQEEFVGGSTAWAAVSPLISVGRAAMGVEGAAAYWLAAVFAMAGAGLMLVRTREPAKQKH